MLGGTNMLNGLSGGLIGQQVGQDIFGGDGPEIGPGELIGGTGDVVDPLIEGGN